MVESKQVGFPWSTAMICGTALAVSYMFYTKQPAPVDNPAVPVVVSDLSRIESVFAAAPKEQVYKMGALYCAIGDQLERLDSLQSSDLRSWLVDADTYFVKGTNIQGAIPGFGDAKDALINQEVGLDDRLLTKEELSKLSNVMHEIASDAGFSAAHK